MSEPIEDLDYLDDDLPSTHVAGGEPFRIDSEERAAWLVGKHRDLDAREQRVKVQSTWMLHAIQQRREGLDRRFGAELRAWLERNTTQRRRSVDFLTGRAGLRRVPGGPRIDDQAKLVAWAKAQKREHIIVRRITERVEADWVATHVASTGEVPDGVVIVEPYDALDIKEAPAPKAKK